MNEASIKRVRIFNLLVFSAILVLFFNYSLSEVLTFTTRINWEGSATQELTFAELYASDVMTGDIPAKYLSRENLHSVDVYQYAAIGVLVFAIAGVIGLLFKGHRPVYIAIVSLICLFVCFVNVESLARYLTNKSFSGPELMMTEQTVLNATTRIIRGLVLISLVFNVLHTPLTGWIGRRISSLNNLLAARTKKRSLDA